jgi:hypothetical protein
MTLGIQFGGGINRSLDVPSVGLGIMGSLGIEKQLSDLKQRQELYDAIKSHKIAIEVAIKTGDMDQVRQANEEWFHREMMEIESYSI